MGVVDGCPLRILKLVWKSEGWTSLEPCNSAAHGSPSAAATARRRTKTHSKFQCLPYSTQQLNPSAWRAKVAMTFSEGAWSKLSGTLWSASKPTAP
eukprot:3471131-Amphidinium_carterae.2